MAIGNGEQQKADGRSAVAAQQKIAKGKEIPFGLGHLAAFDQQEAHMHPVAREGLAGGGFRLRDLVLVMREHQVFAAGVQVEGFAEILHRHGGALDVPAGAAVAERGIPCVLAGLRAFHIAKSEAESFSYSSTSTRAPAVLPLKSFFESLPYSGSPLMRKYQEPSSV